MNKNCNSYSHHNHVTKENYKGIYQKNKKKPIYYEGKAHFSYLILYKKLELIAKNIKFRTDIENKIKLKRININFRSINKIEESPDKKKTINKEMNNKKLLNSNKINLFYHKNKKEEKNASLESKKLDTISKSFLSTNIDGKSRNALSDISLKSHVDTVRSNLTVKNMENDKREIIRLDTVKNLKETHIQRIKCKNYLKIDLNIYKRTIKGEKIKESNVNNSFLQKKINGSLSLNYYTKPGSNVNKSLTLYNPKDHKAFSKK